jgi:arabinogalactan oligomer/maltooligosaccharide transport system permease protein
MNRQQVVATTMSAVVMGLGQIYNRQITKGILLLTAYVLGLYYLIFKFPADLNGLITLGDKVPQIINDRLVGDHSIFLMIDGLIGIILLSFFVIFYIYSVRDAIANGRLIDKGGTPLNIWQEFKEMTSKRFPHMLLVIPGVGIIFFTIFPLIFSILFAFTNYSTPDHFPPGGLIDWVGFDTFADLLFLKTFSYTFYNVALWTVIWAICATITTYFGGLLVALLIQQKGIRFKKLWRTIFILPYAIPQFISLLIWRNLLNENFGAVNQYFELLGFGALPWFNDPTWAKFSIILVNMWIGIPVSMVLTIGVLTTISKDLYEAADVDGATDYQKFRMITLPMVLFSTAPILIMQFAGNINNFNVIYLLTGGNPVVGEYQFAGATDLLVTWLFKISLESSNRLYNIASAIGIIIFVVIATLSIISFRRTKSFKEEDMIQ